MLPWLCPDDRGQTLFDCESCRETLDERGRRAWHCGWMAQSEWLEPCELPPMVGESTAMTAVDPAGPCPGWIVRQPAVLDGARATMALRQSELRTFFPGEQHAVIEAAEAGLQAFNAYEAARLKRTRQE